MEILDDYSLLRIFSYLKLRDLANLEQVSTRFRGLALRSFKVYREINILYEEIKTLSVAKMISSKVGPGLRELIVEDTFSSEMLETFLNNCPNIEHFEFYNIKIQELGMLRLLDDYVANGDIKIKSISFKHCSLDDSHDTMFIRHLERATNLEEVDLTYDSKVTGKCLKFFKNLKTLDLTFCHEIDPDIFDYFCQRNRTLTSLSIDACLRLDEESFNVIFENLKNLRTFKICCLGSWSKDECLSLSLLADLPKLVELELDNCNILAIPLLNRLAHHNRLQKLKWAIPEDAPIEEQDRIMRAVVMIRGLKSFCHIARCCEPCFNDEYLKISPMHNLEILELPETNVTDEGVYNFILRNPSLKDVSLRDCENITDNFATMIIPHLQTDFKSLRIYANHTNMSVENIKILRNKK